MIGAGILGQLAIQFSKWSGGLPIICVDLSENRLKIAKKSGAHYAIGSRGEDIQEEIKKITKGRMADVVFEVTGSPKVIPWSLKLLRRLGRYILLGSTRGRIEVDFHDEVHTLGLKIIGAHNSTHPEYETFYNPWTLHRDAELFFDLLKAKMVDTIFDYSYIFLERSSKSL